MAIRLLLSMLMAGLAGACSGMGDDAPQPPDDIEALMAAAGVPGLSIAYLKEGELAGVHHFGLADTVIGEEVSDATLFEGASLTKPMLSLMAMRLAAAGEIDLDRPLADSFPEERIVDDAAYGLLTPRLILTHRSGLPNWASDPRDRETWGEIPFIRMPGEAFGYSGEAYMLLQRYMAGETGSSFGVFFEEELAGPMPDTALDGIPPGMRPAYGHDGEGGQGQGSRRLDVAPAPGGAYSVLTTARDYARFMGHVCNGDALEADDRAEMLRPQSPVGEGDDISWALGWGVQTGGPRPVVFHWGDNEAFKAFAAFRPETCDGVVYFANAMNGLTLIEPLAEPVVGDLDPVIDWLGYGRVDGDAG